MAVEEGFRRLGRITDHEAGVFWRFPHQGEFDNAIEAIDFYERELPTCTNIFQLVKWCGRAIAEVRNEVAIARYGLESHETEAVYQQGERGLRELFLALREVGEANAN